VTLRPFLSLLLALIAALPALACSGSPPPARPAPAAYRGTPPARPGGTAVVTDFEYPQTLSPLTARTDLELRLGQLLFAPLWSQDPGLRAYPDLVRRVPTPANGGVRVAAGRRSTTVDVQLVPGLRWSDGQPLTADDVVFTWQALAGPSLQGARPPGFERIRAMDRRSATEVVWTLDGVDPAYLLLGDGLFVLPAHRLRAAGDWSAYLARPDVVSGPFAPTGAQAGDRLVLSANPQYGDGRTAPGAYPEGGPFDHAPYLERVVFLPQAGETAEVQALLAQGADAGFHLTPDDLPDLRAAHGSAPVVTTGLRDELLLPNHGSNQATGRAPPWAGDPRVLEALDLALDRTALVRDTLPDAARPARGLYPRALAGLAQGAALPAGAELAAARRRLDAAGWAPGPDGVRVRSGRRLAFSLTGICGRPGLDRELDRIRRQWLPLGAAVTTGCQARDAFLQLAAGGGFDMALYSNRWAPDPSAWAAAGVSGDAANWGRCQDRALDAAFARAGGTLDAGARRSAALAAEQEWLRYRCTIPLFEWPDVRQVSTRLRNFAPDPAAADTWNAADWWLAGTS
jgi:peptide/nickel transport system substrate-binding protein